VRAKLADEIAQQGELVFEAVEVRERFCVLSAGKRGARARESDFGLPPFAFGERHDRRLRVRPATRADRVGPRGRASVVGVLETSGRRGVDRTGLDAVRRDRVVE
jgi:hypothetical protein